MIKQLALQLPPRPWMEAGTCGPLYSRSSDVLRNLFDFPIVNVNVEMNKRLKSEFVLRLFLGIMLLLRLDLRPDQFLMHWTILGQRRGSLTNRCWKSWLGPLTFLSSRTKRSCWKDSPFQCICQPSIFRLSMSTSIARMFPTSQVPNGSDFPRKNTPRWRNGKLLSFLEKWSYRLDNLFVLRNESNSLWCWLMYRIVLANHFRNNILYFPHNMDFRGRVYPISPHLNHMGDDINRCLLKFARGIFKHAFPRSYFLFLRFQVNRWEKKDLTG